MTKLDLLKNLISEYLKGDITKKRLRVKYDSYCTTTK